jgi:5-methylcytosine-specific restriction protein A
MRLTGFSPIVRKQIQDRSEGLCELCGCFEAVQMHHRRARGMGSTRRPETNQAGNALHICADDHYWVENNRSLSLQRGWLVSQHRTPAEVPVLRRGVWVLLDNHGDYIEIPEPAGGKVA